MPDVSTVYLIPCYLLEGVLDPIPPYVLDAVKKCQVFFVENERTARRYLKSLWREMVIDDYEWHNISKLSEEAKQAFAGTLRKGSNIGILSEAGCPGIADPGQVLVELAHQAGARVRPLVGPSSILLALMASGLNGQHFRFLGYLPIDRSERRKAIQQLEEEVRHNQATQIFIETPYRNEQIFQELLQTARPETNLCIAVNITGANEFIMTKTIRAWNQSPMPDIKKQPAIFLIG